MGKRDTATLEESGFISRLDLHNPGPMFRVRRAYSGITTTMLTMPPALFQETCRRLYLLETTMPNLQIPPDVEAAREDGWCLLMPGGASFAGTPVPLTMRDDDTREVQGSVVQVEARGADLWGLLVFAKAGESDETFAARCRVAREVKA